MLYAYLALAGRILLLGVERIVVKRLGHDSHYMAAAFHFFALGAAMLLPFVLTDLPSSWSFVFKPMASGLFYALGFALYVKSLAEGEASLVSPLYHFNVFFLAILAFFFLGEPLTILKVGGLLLLVYGATYLNRQKNILQSMKALITDAPCRYMIITSLLLACGRIVDKYAISFTPAGEEDVSPLAYVFVLYVVISLYIFIMTLFKGKTAEIGKVLKTAPWLALICGAINSYSYLFLLYAMRYFDVSVAEPISMLSVIVTILLAWKTFGEDIRTRLVGAGIMVAGAWALFL